MLSWNQDRGGESSASSLAVLEIQVEGKPGN